MLQRQDGILSVNTTKRHLPKTCIWLIIIHYRRLHTDASVAADRQKLITFYV